MKKSLKQKLALFLAIIMLFTMSLPVSMMASAAEGDEIVTPGEGEEIVPGEGEEIVPGEGEGEGEEPPVVVDPNVIPALTGDVTAKVDLTTVASTNTGFTGEGADNLFVAVKNTKFCGNVAFPFTVSWTMTEATAITAYALTSGGDSATYSTRDPRGWEFYGSNDGEAWDLLDARADQGFGKNGLTKIFAFENETAYTQYKLVITDAAISMIQFAAIQLSDADLSADDADVAAAAAAAAFDEKLAAVGELTAENYEEKIAEIEALRREYNALDNATKNKVKNTNVLTDAEAFVLKLELVPVLEALLAEIDAEMAAGATDGYVYSTNGKITTALGLLKDLGGAASSIPANTAEVLAAYRTMLDEALNASYTASVGNITNTPATNAPWMETMTEDDINATKAAVVAELIEQYTRQGFALNDALTAPGASINLTTTWGNIVLAQLEGGDNVTDPWGMGRRWSCLVAPFAGMAFTVKKYMGSTGDGQDLNILSNEFIYNGRVYQQRWSRLLSYEFGADADGSIPSLREETMYPGKGSSSDLTKNSFRYAYAKYNNENKAAGLNVGVPAGAAVAADGVVYQAFKSADGTAYIAASATAIATADALNPSEVAHVIAGDILAAVLAEGEDFASAIAVTGAPITCVDAEGVQLFENGVATADGFEEYTAENAHLKVEVLLANLPTAVTRDTLENVALAIEDAEAAVAELADPSVVDTTALNALKEAYTALKADVDAAVAVEELIAAIATPITLESGEAIEAAQAAFDQLTDSQKAQVLNYADLDGYARTYNKLIADQKVKEVEDMIDALPEDQDIGGDNFDAEKEQIFAAMDAYEALDAESQSNVSDDRYFALIQKVEIAEAGGYEEWMPKYELGDVDMNEVIDVADIMKLKALIMADKWTPDEETYGDVNASGALDVGDIMEIKSMIMAG